MVRVRALAMAVLMAGPALAQPYAGYVLGPDDAVQVVVYGNQDFNVTTRIKSDGTIVMPLIGSVKAEGQTNITLAKVISDRLVQGGYLKDPIVNVEVGGYVARSVAVAGKVSAPGIYPLDRQYRVLDVLLKAGWVREGGAAYVYLRRPGAQEVRLDAEAMARGTEKENPLLQPGDTLYIPEADTFFIYGQINSPGIKPILPGMTIRQAIALAGGVTPTGKSDKVGLVRGSGKEVDTDVAQTVQKGDVIIIKERLF